jgi:hypothetical protein
VAVVVEVVFEDVVAAAVATGASVAALDAVDVVVAAVVAAGAAVVAAGASVVVDAALEAVDVVVLETDAHTPEKPLAIEYTLSTRPLVGTVRSQSGGFNAATDEMSDWQLSDAHIWTYWASVGIDVEYSRLKPESSAQPWNELSDSTPASAVKALDCCVDVHVWAVAEPTKAAAATARTVLVFMVPGWRVFGLCLKQSKLRNESVAAAASTCLLGVRAPVESYEQEGSVELPSHVQEGVHNTRNTACCSFSCVVAMRKVLQKRAERGCVASGR